jgi:hypothetical protein
MQRTAATGLSSRNVLLAAAASRTLAAPAVAGAKLKEKTVSTGLARLGNETTVRTWAIAGDHSRSDGQSTGRDRFPAPGGMPRK